MTSLIRLAPSVRGPAPPRAVTWPTLDPAARFMADASLTIAYQRGEASPPVAGCREIVTSRNAWERTGTRPCHLPGDGDAKVRAMPEISGETLRAWRRSWGWDAPELARQLRKGCATHPGVHVRFVGNQDHLRVWAGQAVPSGCDDHDRQASCDRLVAIAAGDDHAARRRHSLLLGTTALTSAFRSGCDLCNQTRRSTRPNSEAPTLMSCTPHPAGCLKMSVAGATMSRGRKLR